MEKTFFVYIMTNKRRTVFYTGMTNNLIRRVYEHKNKLIDGFTKKYNVEHLVYFEQSNNPITAIEREKQIKDFRRSKKIALIEALNPEGQDLYDGLL
ncbi:MAG: GIY-YIG nuclease family protein [Candidatus Omnitrophica bacterium]|nr:GIY-YIG nuclease family protein [Candidatus Omnitrophota bacterium]